LFVCLFICVVQECCIRAKAYVLFVCIFRIQKVFRSAINLLLIQINWSEK
jgi:hypothetical protein